MELQSESQNLAMRGLSTTAGVRMAWVAVTGALGLASSFPAAPPSLPFPAAKAVSLSFEIFQMDTRYLL